MVHSCQLFDFGASCRVHAPRCVDEHGRGRLPHSTASFGPHNSPGSPQTTAVVAAHAASRCERGLGLASGLWIRFWICAARLVGGVCLAVKRLRGCVRESTGACRWLRVSCRVFGMSSPNSRRRGKRQSTIGRCGHAGEQWQPGGSGGGWGGRVPAAQGPHPRSSPSAGGCSRPEVTRTQSRRQACIYSLPVQCSSELCGWAGSRLLTVVLLGLNFALPCWTCACVCQIPAPAQHPRRRPSMRKVRWRERTKLSALQISCTWQPFVKSDSLRNHCSGRSL